MAEKLSIVVKNVTLHLRLGKPYMSTKSKIILTNETKLTIFS
jgi:hypothetical protein